MPEAFDRVKTQIGACGICYGSCGVGNGSLRGRSRRFEKILESRGVGEWAPPSSTTLRSRRGSPPSATSPPAPDAETAGQRELRDEDVHDRSQPFRVRGMRRTCFLSARRDPSTDACP